MIDLPPGIAPDEQVLSLHAEDMTVGRRTRHTGAVQVAVATHVRNQPVDQVLSRTAAHVEHVPVGRFVDEMPGTRNEGDTTVIPIVEEVLVTRLFLREEVHVTRVTTTHRHQDSVSLRSEEAIVTRTGPDGAPLGPNFEQHPVTTKETDHG